MRSIQNVLALGFYVAGAMITSRMGDTTAFCGFLAGTFVTASMLAYLIIRK